MQRQSGFTIVEVLVVVAIIALLGMVAVPAYQSYAVRARHAEVIQTVGSCRTAVSELLTAAVAAAAPDWTCNASSTATRYVAAIGVETSGRITVTTRDLPNKADGSQGGRLTLMPLGAAGLPAVQGSSVSRWRCGSAEDGTDIVASLLPGSCRGG